MSTSMTPPGYPPVPRRGVTLSWPVLLVGAAFLVLLTSVVTAATTAAVVRGHRPAAAVAASAVRSESPSPSGTPSPSPSASASATPGNPLLDPCLVGLWRETSNLQDIQIDGAPRRFTSSGAIQRFAADGTAAVDYGTANTRTGTAGGDHWEFITTGNLSYHYQTNQGSILYSDAHADGSILRKRNGSVYDRVPLTASITPERYTCTPDSLREFGENYTIELVRM
jgi:hypothetical protein